MQEEGSVWVQEQATTHLNERTIVTAPLGIVYDQRSGNVILAMGIQGIIVGTPDGRWGRYAVGRYTPVDLSFSGKTRVLLTSAYLWTAATALSLSMWGVAVVGSRYRRTDLPMLAGVSLIAIGLLVGLPALLVATAQDRTLDGLAKAGFDSAPLLIVLLIIGTIMVCFFPKQSPVRQYAGLGLGALALLASVPLLYIFGSSITETGNVYDLQVAALSVLAFVFGLLSLAVSREELRHWRVVIPVFVGMNVLVALVFML